MKPTSTEIVLTTPELLIIILTHLPFSDLLISCTAVSKTWHTTILSTPSLLRILHMHSTQPQTPTGLHPFLKEKDSFPLYLQFPRHERQHPGLAGSFHDPFLYRSPEATEETPLERFNYEKASWRRMLVLTGQPLITRARVKESIEVGRGRMAGVYERKSIMLFSEGFRLGDLWKLCEKRWCRRMQPLQAVVKLQWMRGGKKRSVVFHSQIVDDTAYEGGNQGLLGWVVGIKERRREREREKNKNDQMALEMLDGVQYGRSGEGRLGEEEIEVELVMARAETRFVREEEFRDCLRDELVRKGFVKVGVLSR
ncbi:hypothetical protein DL98DRAFT_569857 [Cadophora sp. DSE1049]|nr:hypothetical protein DL98DRAFT_569857 [Cadophora sp. DSE1049]